MSEPESSPGTISWTEIPVLDLARAKKFYEDVFGWSYTSVAAAGTEEAKDLERNYVLFNKGTTHGGFCQVSEDCHASPAKLPSTKLPSTKLPSNGKAKMSVCVTITVDNIDETFKLIEKAGGEVYKKKVPIPGNMGFAARFLDTEKNVMGMWALH